MVLYSMYLPTELLEVRLSAQCSELAILEIGLMNELRYRWYVMSAELVVLHWTTASE